MKEQTRLLLQKIREDIHTSLDLKVGMMNKII